MKDDEAARAFAVGIAAIRTQYGVPDGFPDAVLAAADAAAARPIDDGRVDLTDVAFVTLDPLSSTDLDQAFAVGRDGADLVLQYAIADVAWFVRPGDPIDVEAWTRALTVYLPGQRAGLHPPVLAEGAASLLPDGPRPAVVFTVGVAPDGTAALRDARRAVVRSRAKLGYETVTEAELPDGFAELSRRIALAEDTRGAGRVEFPEQTVQASTDGEMQLVFEARLPSAEQNSALSLATNLAVAAALQAAGTGLFRVMAEPDERAIKRLRHTAHALRLNWPRVQSLAQFQRGLDAHDPRAAAFLLAVRRAGGKASYAPFAPGVVPWHSAMAATYAQATAPLRRLADRYVVEAAVAVATGAAVPDWVEDAFGRLPEVMDRAAAREGQIERAVLDLAEAIALHGHEGAEFDAVVTDTDERGSRIQITDPAVVSRVGRNGYQPGDEIRVRLVEADPVTRTIRFE
jgi:exoribonuclease R